MADSIHSVRKTLRLMPGEAKELSEKAGTAGMCEADYLRLLITQKPNDYPEIRILLKELINEVNAIGNNINQLSVKANALGFIDSQMLKNEAQRWHKFQTDVEREFLRPEKSGLKWQ